ncbi:MAG: PQQ-binding-like beta-propeller repeat protein [Planctomycetes bacterium]|nr:PQQ-binding-like beta-propeller repeat protein [Planctomycetota bacterium]
MLSTTTLLLCLAAARSAAPGGPAWPEYRGPRQDGYAAATRLPLEWSEAKNVRWKTAMHDRGWSSPVVSERKVWLTTATEDGKELFVIAVDRESGEVLLDRKLFDVESPRPLGNDVNTYASPSPVLEPGRVYVHFGSDGTACLDESSSEVLWQRRDLPCDHFRGAASSPVIFENLLILQMDGVDFQYLAALEKTTGKTVWKKDRSTVFGDLDADGRPIAGGDFRKAYNTPFIARLDGQTEMVSPGAKAVFSYDPRDGSEIWTVRYPGHSSASRTLLGRGLWFVNTGYTRAELWAIRTGGRGDITGSHVAWKTARNVPNRSSPVLVGARLYMVDDGGIASCLDAETGREVWRERIGGRYSSCLLYGAGRIHFFSEEGETVIIRPTDRFEVLARNRLDAGCLASPGVAGDALFVRTKTHLYRIEEAQAASALPSAAAGETSTSR